MPTIAYIERQFRPASLDIIHAANGFIAAYAEQGLPAPTVRQLYYRLVATNAIPNTVTSYDNLQSLLNDARLAGRIDWEAIQDRTREPVVNTHWQNPQHIINATATSYMVDRWANQKNRVEVWVEKEALAGVLEGVCAELDVLFLACRGYPSVSELWRAAMRLVRYAKGGQHPVIIHLGDHDPSGLDMTRDIRDRLHLLMGGGERADELEVKRVALNMEQVEAYNPPPNPAKTTDSRFADYSAKFGDESWELDALESPVLIQLVRDTVAEYRDDKKMRKVIKSEKAETAALTACADNWPQVREFLNA